MSEHNQNEKNPQITKQSQKSRLPKIVAITQSVIASANVVMAQNITSTTHLPAFCEAVGFLRGLDECSALIRPIS